MSIKKTVMITVFVSAIFVGVNFMVAQAYEPLVRLPGLPATGDINLSQYIVGLYNFLLSIVGIVAVMMLIIGGMKYITAAGNASTIGDAKDTIWNAIFGLLLALLSWVIVSTINPDVLYIKAPASGLVDSYKSDLGACGEYDPATTICTCDDGTTSAAVDQPTCKTACASTCDLTEALPCVVISNEPHGDKCYCADKTEQTLVAGVDCQTTCLTHCLLADIKIGIADFSTASNDPDLIEKVINSTPLQNGKDPIYPLFLSEGEPFSFLITSLPGSVSPYGDDTRYKFDITPPFDGNVVFPDYIGVGSLGSSWVTSGDLPFPPTSGMIGMWAAIDANPGNCKKKPILNTAYDEAWVCPMSLQITDVTGVGPDSNIDTAWVGFLKP